MNYCQFIRAVEQKVKEGVKGQVSVAVHTSIKNNGVRKYGLILTQPGINISPTIYLEEYYQQYKRGDSLENIAGNILRLYGEIRFERSWEGEYIKEYTNVQNKIIYHLVNAASNEERLKEVPFRKYLDLAIIFSVLVEINVYGTASMLVTKEHLAMWGITAEEVYEMACQNTRTLLPEELQSMGHAIEGMTGIEIMNGTEDGDNEDMMYILSNKIQSHGAAVILYEDCLKGIGEILKENYYVLPSSVHEVIIVPESHSPGQEELTSLVREMNESQILKDEILSDHAYYYAREEQELFLLKEPDTSVRQ